MQKCRGYIFKLIENYEVRIISLRQICDQAEKWIQNDELSNVLSNNTVSAGFIEQRIEEVVSMNIKHEFENQISEQLSQIAFQNNEFQERDNITKIKMSENENLLLDNQQQRDEILKVSSELEYLQNKNFEETQIQESKIMENNNSLMEKEVQLLKIVRNLKMENEKLQRDVQSCDTDYDTLNQKYESVFEEKKSFENLYEKLSKNEQGVKEEFDRLNNELNETKSVLKKSESTNQILQDELQVTREKNYECKEDSQNFKWSVKQLEEQLNYEKSKHKIEFEEKEKYVQRLNSEMEFNLEKNKEDFENIIKSKNTEINEISKKHENLEKILPEKEELIYNLEIEVKQKSNNLENFYEEKIKNLKDEYKKDLQELQKGYDKIMMEGSGYVSSRVLSSQNTCNCTSMSKYNENNKNSSNLPNYTNFDKDYILKSKHEKIQFKECFEVKQKYIQNMTVLEETYSKKYQDSLELECNKNQQIYKNNIKVLEEKNEALMLKIKELETSDDKQKNEALSQIETINDLRNLLNDKKIELETTVSKINELNKEINEFSKIKLEQVKKISKLETDLSLKDMNIKSSENSKEIFEKKLKDLEQEFEKIKSNNFELIDTNCKLNKEIANYEKLKEENYMQINSLKKYIEVLKNDYKGIVDKLNNKAKGSDVEFQKLQLKNSELQYEIESRDQHHTSLNEEIKKLEECKQSLKKDLTEAEYKIKKVESQEAELSQSHKSKLELEDKIQEKAKEIESIKNSKKRYKKTMQRLLDVVQNNLKDVCKEVKVLKNIIKTQKPFMLNLFEDKKKYFLEYLSFEIKRWIGNLLDNKKIEFDGDIKDKEAMIDELEKGLDQFKSKEKELEIAKHEQALEKDNLFTEIEELKEKVNDWESAYQQMEYELSSKLDEQENELNGYKRSIKCSRDEMELKNKMIEKFKVDRKDNQKMLSNLKGELIEKKIMNKLEDFSANKVSHKQF